MLSLRPFSLVRSIRNGIAQLRLLSDFDSDRRGGANFDRSGGEGGGFERRGGAGFDRDSGTGGSRFRNPRRLEKTINSVQLLGRVGRDAEQRHRFVVFPIATSDNFIDSSGAVNQQPEWHRVMVFKPQLQTFAARIQKGDRVLVQGRLRPVSYTKPDGTRFTIVSVRAEDITSLHRREHRNQYETGKAAAVRDEFDDEPVELAEHPAAGGGASPADADDLELDDEIEEPPPRRGATRREFEEPKQEKQSEATSRAATPAMRHEFDVHDEEELVSAMQEKKKVQERGGAMRREFDDERMKQEKQSETASPSKTAAAV